MFKTNSDRIFMYKCLVQFQKEIKKLFEIKLPFRIIASFITFKIKYFCSFVNLNNKIIIIKSNNFKNELKKVNLSFMIEYDRFYNKNPFIKKEIFYISIRTNFNI